MLAIKTYSNIFKNLNVLFIEFVRFSSYVSIGRIVYLSRKAVSKVVPNIWTLSYIKKKTSIIDTKSSIFKIPIGVGKIRFEVLYIFTLAYHLYSTPLLFGKLLSMRQPKIHLEDLYFYRWQLHRRH